MSSTPTYDLAEITAELAALRTSHDAIRAQLAELLAAGPGDSIGGLGHGGGGGGVPQAQIEAIAAHASAVPLGGPAITKFEALGDNAVSGEFAAPPLEGSTLVLGMVAELSAENITKIVGCGATWTRIARSHTSVHHVCIDLWLGTGCNGQEKKVELTMEGKAESEPVFACQVVYGVTGLDTVAVVENAEVPTSELNNLGAPFVAPTSPGPEKDVLYAVLIAASSGAHASKHTNQLGWIETTVGANASTGGFWLLMSPEANKVSLENPFYCPQESVAAAGSIYSAITAVFKTVRGAAELEAAGKLPAAQAAKNTAGVPEAWEEPELGGGRNEELEELVPTAPFGYRVELDEQGGTAPRVPYSLRYKGALKIKAAKNSFFTETEGETTEGSAVVVKINTTSMKIGQVVTGTNIPAGTTIKSVKKAGAEGELELTNKATGTGKVTLTVTTSLVTLPTADRTHVTRTHHKFLYVGTTLTAEPKPVLATISPTIGTVTLAREIKAGEVLWLDDFVVPLG